MEEHVSRYLVALCHEFGAISPLNVYDLELRHYLTLTRAIDEMRAQARKDRSG